MGDRDIAKVAEQCARELKAAAARLANVARGRLHGPIAFDPSKPPRIDHEDPLVIGLKGEIAVQEVLRRRLLQNAPEGTYRVWNRAHLNYRASATEWREAEIDHLVVSRHGIFAVETKNWGGDAIEFVPNPHPDRKHTYTVKIDGRERDYEDPFTQTNGHVQALLSLLGAKANRWITPIICFVHPKRVIGPNPDPKRIVHWQDLVSRIRKNERDEMPNNKFQNWKHELAKWYVDKLQLHEGAQECDAVIDAAGGIDQILKQELGTAKI